MKTIKTTTAADGTTLKLKQRDDGDYIVTEGGSNQRVDEIKRSRAAGERQLEETSELYGVAEEARQRDRRTGIDMGGGMDMGGGLFGGGYDDAERDSRDDMDMGGGLFGGGGGDLFGGAYDDAERDSRDDMGGGMDMGGGLFGRGGGGGGSGDSLRDAETGKFAPKRTRRAEFEMERNDDGTFAGRKDDDRDDNGGGLFGFLR